MTLARLRHLGLLRPVLVTALLLLAYGAYDRWLAWAGARKLTPAELARPGDRLAFEVVLHFPPEAFHVTRMQAIGRLIEVRGHSVFLMDVRRADARILARDYWVADIMPWPGR